jgi:hypothetical protein
MNSLCIVEKQKKLLESQKKEVEDYHQTMW